MTGRQDLDPEPGGLSPGEWILIVLASMVLAGLVTCPHGPQEPRGSTQHQAGPSPTLAANGAHGAPGSAVAARSRGYPP